MQSTLNSELLSSMVKSKRGKRGLRETAAEIGEISAATLSRIEQGKLPDVETFIMICKWLDVSTDTFISVPVKTSRSNSTKVSEKDMLVYQLRASRELDKDTVETMIRMVDMAFTKVRKDGKK